MNASAALRDLRAAGREDLAGRLDALLAVMARRSVADEAFATELEAALGGNRAISQRRPEPARRGGRRPPGPFDPFAAYAESENALRRRLAACDIEELRNIVAEHGMDHDRLAMRWKSPDRLIERIVSTVSARVRKGEAFRASTT